MTELAKHVANYLRRELAFPGNRVTQVIESEPGRAVFFAKRGPNTVRVTVEEVEPGDV